ncbi:hypothetical protein WMF45_00255 [Sorangium sp. So ce448]|uniref:hypothetical protein n=1 Tax=unclassified Sorangium TaxID=2621164 RepID=UPI003F5D6385
MRAIFARKFKSGYECWPDEAEGLSELAESFPSLADAPGVRPFRPLKLARWADERLRSAKEPHEAEGRSLLARHPERFAVLHRGRLEASLLAAERAYQSAAFVLSLYPEHYAHGADEDVRRVVAGFSLLEATRLRWSTSTDPATDEPSDALRVWDRAHRSAFAAWAAEAWRPRGLIQRWTTEGER